MALKIKIGASEFEKLSDDVKKEYKKTGDDYTLDLTDYEDPAEIRRARDAANQERNEAKRAAAAEKTRADKLQTDYDALKGAADQKTQDIANLTTEWQGKVTAAENSAKEKLDAIKSNISKDKAGSAAFELAQKIAKAPKLLAPEIAKRLQVTVDDEFNTSTVILGKDGKPCAMSMDDLQKEFFTNPDYADIMIGTRGSGGGGAPSPGPGGGAPRFGNPGHSPKLRDGSPDLSKMDAASLAAHVRDNKVGRPDA